MNRMFCRKVFICLPVAAFALAQQQPNFRAGARLVQVDVIVRDSHGPLTDLTKDDFGLFDRGKRQQISVFIVNAGRNSDRSPALTTREVSNRPDLSSGEAPSTTLVLVDFLNSRWQDQYFVRGELARFVGALGDSDRMALLALKKNLVVLQNFTNALNREQLLQAVERLPFEVNEGQLPGEQTVYWAKVRKGITERVLQSILRHLAAMPGRRNLIWISGNFWYDSRRQVLISPDVMRLLRESGVALYLLGASGLKAPPGAVDRGLAGFPSVAGRGRPMSMPPTRTTGSARANGFEGVANEFLVSRDLTHFAESTGGLGLFNSNDLRNALEKAMQDVAVTYTLGFYPPESALDGTEHSLKVKVARKGVEVRYRKSWYASADGNASGMQSEQWLKQLAEDPLETTAIGLTAVARRSGEELAIDLSMHLPDLQLQPEGERRRGSIDVGYVLNEDNGLTFRTINLDLSEEEFRAAMRKPYGVSVTIPLVPGTAGQVRILVRDRASGAAGSLRLALSPR